MSDFLPPTFKTAIFRLDYWHRVLLSRDADARRDGGRGAVGDEFGSAFIAVYHPGRRDTGAVHPGIFPFMTTDR